MLAMALNKYTTERVDSNIVISIPVRKYAYTCGDGHWSDTAKKVFIQKLVFTVEENPSEYYNGDWFCMVNAYFSKTSWSIAKDGLIYTDSLFLKHIKIILADLGFPMTLVSLVRYSEQGMQHRSYVNMEAYELGNYIYDKYGCHGNQLTIKTS